MSLIYNSKLRLVHIYIYIHIPTYMRSKKKKKERRKTIKQPHITLSFTNVIIRIIIPIAFYNDVTRFTYEKLFLLH